MSKRSASDPEWNDELWRRWERRRALPFRQFAEARAELGAAVAEAVTPLVVALDRILRHWPALYRWLGGDS